MSTEYDCQRCGACCTTYGKQNNRRYVAVKESESARIDPKLRWQDPHWFGTAEDENEEFSPHWMRMVRSNCHELIRCIALEGVVGERVACGIYENRPSVCSSFEPGSYECKKARRRWEQYDLVQIRLRKSRIAKAS